jgi:ATP-dependent DNA helicase DinG
MSIWLAAEKAFAQSMPGYEPRINQRNLAMAIEKNYADGGHLLAQAGTGTGKSLGGGVPAIDFAKRTGLPVVISTATKTLQDQYVRDFTRLQELFPELNFTFTVLKGRGNYACLAKVAEANEVDIFGLKSLREELEHPECSGDLDQLITEIAAADRRHVTSSSDECPGKSNCRFSADCFAEKAKNRAQTVDVIIVNHSMMIMDLKLREMTRDEETGRSLVSVLPMNIAGYLIDEAHELEEYATSSLGGEFSQGSLSAFGAQVAALAGDPMVASTLNGGAKILFDQLAQSLGRERTRAIDDTMLLGLEGNATRVLATIRTLKGVIKGVDVHGDDNKGMRRKRLMRRADSLEARLEGFMLAEEEDIVRWVEKDDKRGALLKFAPLHVGPFLAQNLWIKPAVLLSATLAVGNDFSYIAERLGLGRDYRSFDAGTPFDYPKQSALFVPENFDPSPKNSMKWRGQVAATIPELIRAAGGRSLLLFTSTSAMKEAYAATKGAIEGMGFQVLMQGDRSNRALSDEFKRDETSVLFALKSFMTGFDVPGDSLRLVILDKMPFPNPSDVIFAARCAAVDRVARNWNQKSFMRISVPAMILTLLQAFGRLIRTTTDEGMVVILDSRLIGSTGYAKVVRAAMPNARKLNTLAEAREYLAELSSRRD